MPNKHQASLEMFVKYVFQQLSPGVEFLNNWHIRAMCNILNMVHTGKVKKLIICMPPRYLKSICVSTAFPAWVLGNSPTKKIVVASYAMQLAEKLSCDIRSVVSQPSYEELFPKIEWSKSVNSKRKFMTNTQGSYLATSVNGTLTGEGADILIADDPQKPINILSKSYRQKTYEWFTGTFLSRLNNRKTGAVILVMQRLHVDDLVGRITKNKMDSSLIQTCNGWCVLNLPAIAMQGDEFRTKGEPLHNERDDIAILRDIEQQVGQNVFKAQYQQAPSNKSCGSLKRYQLHCEKSDISQLIQHGVFISVDTAYKCGDDNDYTAISLWVKKGEATILFSVIKERLEFNQIVETLKELLGQHQVKALLIEDKGSGISVIQTLQKEYGKLIVPIKVQHSKEIRFHSTIYYFANGLVKLHSSLNKSVIEDLTSFPYCKHDDVVDSISQFINWYFLQERTPKVEPQIRMF